MRRRQFVTLATGTMALAAAGLMKTARAQEDDEGILVYNAQHESLTREWADGFTKATGIKVTVRKGSDMELANQIVQEDDGTPADVFLTENSPAMALVDRAGLFEPLDQATLDLVPAHFRPAEGNWIGIAARSTVFAYDKTRLAPEQLPASMDDLALPDWRGRWAASPSGADFQAILAAYLNLRGEAKTRAWLQAMKENAVVYKGNSTCMRAVNVGKVDAALIYHYYYYGDQSKTGENSGNIGLHYFRHQDPGAFVSISGGGVLALSRKKTQAKAFVTWIAGKDGQDILKTGNSFEYAVGTGAQSNPALVPLAELDAPKIEPSKLDNKKVTDMMTEAGML